MLRQQDFSLIAKISRGQDSVGAVVNGFQTRWDQNDERREKVSLGSRGLEVAQKKPRAKGCAEADCSREEGHYSSAADKQPS